MRAKLWPKPLRDSLLATALWIVGAQLILAPALPSLALAAADSSPFATAGELGGAAAGGAEYITGNTPGAILVRVNLMGAVIKPGIHHVPAQTDILTFLSLAGGPTAEGRIDEVSIKRRTGPKPGDERIIKVNVEDLAQKTGLVPPTLEPNDIVLVPRDRPLISNNATATLSLISTVLGLIVTTFAVVSLTKNKGQ